MSVETWNESKDLDLTAVNKAIAATALAYLDGLEDTKLPNPKTDDKAQIELRERVRLLLEDQAMVVQQQLAGRVMDTAQEALNARAKGLASAGLSIGAVQVQAAIRHAFASVLRWLQI